MQTRKLMMLSLLAIGATAASSNAATVAYWRFEDGTAGNNISTTADSSGNGYTLSNITPAHPDGVNPQFAASTNFPNPVPATAAANTGTGSFTTGALASNTTGGLQNTGFNGLAGDNTFTIEMFFRHTSTRWQDLFLLGDGTNGTIFLQTEYGANPGSVRWSQTGNDDKIYTAPDWLASNTTHHLAIVRTHDPFTQAPSGGTMDLYLDGVLWQSQGLAYYVPNGFKLGTGNAETFDGFIDEVRISDESLTPSQFLNVSVPEPTSLALVGLAGLAMFRRHRAV